MKYCLSSDLYNVYWRCVRGGKEIDVGNAHRNCTSCNIAYKQEYDAQIHLTADYNRMFVPMMIWFIVVRESSTAIRVLAEFSIIID